MTYYNQRTLLSLAMRLKHFNCHQSGRVTGQNGIRTKWYWTKWYGQNGMDKMVRTKWYGQNDTILYFVYILIQLNSIYI